MYNIINEKKFRRRFPLAVLFHLGVGIRTPIELQIRIFDVFPAKQYPVGIGFRISVGILHFLKRIYGFW